MIVILNILCRMLNYFNVVVVSVLITMYSWWLSGTYPSKALKSGLIYLFEICAPVPFIRYFSSDDALWCTGTLTCMKLSFSQTTFEGGSTSEKSPSPKKKMLLVEQFLSLTNQYFGKGSDLKMV